MKMKRKLLLLLLVLTIMCNSNKYVSANDTTQQQIEKVLENKNELEKSDLHNVKIALKKYLKKAQGAREETETLSGVESCLGYEQYQYDKAYAVYPLEMYMITEYQKQNENFDKLIADQREWRVPYKTADGKRGFDESIVINMKDDEVGGALPYRQTHITKYIIVGSIIAGVFVFLLRRLLLCLQKNR